MGNASRKARLLARVLRNSSRVRFKTNSLSFRRWRVRYVRRGFRLVRQMCRDTRSLWPEGKGLLQHLLPGRQEGRGRRPILNLKWFNQYLVKRSFKMETLPSIISIMTPGVWLASIDLKDAYLHVAMAESAWKFLRFLIGDQHLQFTVTPFGLSPAPLLFTRVVRVLICWLRMRGVHLYAYLDDILIVGSSPEAVLHSLRLTVQVFVKAGFVINITKSDLEPSQDLVYIGGRFRTNLGRVFLPEDRREALIRAVSAFARVGVYHPVRRWMQILGLMAATIQTVEFARLSMRSVQWHLKDSWKSRNLLDMVMVTRHVFEALQWWTVRQNLSLGRPFQPPKATLTVTTDASKLGWGGHSSLNGQTFLFSGLWTPEETRLHINVLELRAIRLTVQKLQLHIRDQVVKVECDNTTAIAYLNKQGGTRSYILCQEALRLHEWMCQFNVTLQAIHRPGVNNELADYLSRNRPDPTEWSLSLHSCRKLFKLWGTPQVDLFAAPDNHKLPTWFSKIPHPLAAGTNAFNQTWTGLFVYAFPPFNLIQKTLLQIRDQGVEEAIVVVPNWPARPWYHLLREMATEAFFCSSWRSISCRRSSKIEVFSFTRISDRFTCRHGS